MKNTALGKVGSPKVNGASLQVTSTSQGAAGRRATRNYLMTLRVGLGEAC